jgi:predicted RNA-binding Zn ribbon-like protein
MAVDSPPIFLADALALDFLNSIATPRDQVVDWLDDGEGLLGWLEQAGLVPLADLTRLRTVSRRDELDKVATNARKLREWFRGFVRSNMGSAPRPEVALPQLASLNELLEQDHTFTRLALVRGTSELRVEIVHRWPSPESLLVPIARAMADLVAANEFPLVKACEGENCTLLFVDRTHRHSRRWCSMALCGNRAKQAAHRQRGRTAQAEATVPSHGGRRKAN